MEFISIPDTPFFVFEDIARAHLCASRTCKLPHTWKDVQPQPIWDSKELHRPRIFCAKVPGLWMIQCTSNPTGPALTLFQISNKSTELDRTFRNTFEDIHLQLETVAESIISTIICSYINQVNYIYQYLHQKKNNESHEAKVGIFV